MSADEARGTGRPVRVHVSARGNAFMRDIAAWFVEAAALAGYEASLDTELPRDDGAIHLAVAPHELFPLSGAAEAEIGAAVAASVLICTEQPGTPWFDTTLALARRAAAVLDINVIAVDALREAGIDARHLHLGAVPSMTAPAAATVAGRPLDVLFLGALDGRRGEVLAGLAPRLAPRTAELRLFRFDRPVGHDAPGLVFGHDKYGLLASASTLLNVHRAANGDARPYFEWARMVEAMANRCVVVTEPSEGTSPLVPGTHFVEATVDRLGDVLDALLDDADRRAAIADAAFAAVTGELALRTTMARVLDRIERDHATGRRRPAKASRQPAPRRPIAPGFAAFRPHQELQRAAKRAAVAEDRLVRRLDAAACVLHHGTEQHIERWTTAAWDECIPEVTVVVPLYDYASVVVETLDSISASEDVTFEIVVVEDHATDASSNVVRAWMDAHPEVPLLLLGKEVNEGLSAARNTGFDAARAELVMTLDADNLLYPRCLRRLADALRTDPGAAAAYSILEDFGAAAALRSALDWDVERLCRGNYLDAQAMWRRSTWADLGGYRSDEGDVYGWEDWDLWLRLAAHGGRATIVRQALGRYRVQPTSMVALSNVAQDLAVTAIRQRYPSLPWPADTPG